MLEQLSDSFRKAAESSLQTQQDMFKQWAQQWPSKHSRTAGSALELAEECQKRWRQVIIETLDSNRDLVDLAYKSTIRLIEQTFSFYRAKSPDELRRSAEDLWCSLKASVKAQADGHIRILQTASERVFELSAKPAVPSEP
jgi:hypothetical protein